MRSSGLSALVVVVGGFRKERKVDEMTQNYGIPQELNEEMARVVSLCPEAAAVFEKLVALIALHPLEVDSKATDRQGRVDSGTTGPPLSEVPGLGFIQPVRKKLTLNIHEGMFSVGGLPPGSSPCTLPFGAVTDVFCLPTPNKSRPHYTVILLTSAQNPGETSYACPPDTFVFGFDDKLPTERDVVLNKILGIPAFKTARILQPSPAIMRSAKSQKGKPPVLFIEAYLGSKEG